MKTKFTKSSILLFHSSLLITLVVSSGHGIQSGKEQNIQFMKGGM